jgi:hypothetical protein
LVLFFHQILAPTPRKGEKGKKAGVGAAKALEVMHLN